MSDTSNALLQQAYTHIENDELEKAQEILAPLLEDEANNAHLWWVYTHAARDASIGQAALERVLELDPQYPGARELKADVLEAQAKDPDLIAFEAGDSRADDAAAPFEVDDWEDLQPAVDSDADGSSSRGRLVIVMLLVLLVVIAGGAIVISGAVDINELLSGLSPSPEPQVIIVPEPLSDLIVSIQESEATAAPATATALPERAAAGSLEVGETEQAATASPTMEEATAVETATPTATIDARPSPTINADSAGITSYVSLVAEEIAEFAIELPKSGTLPTKLGNTLIIFVCAIPGPEFNARLNTVMTTAASLADDLPEAIEAVAAGLLNCDDEQASLRIVGVAGETLVAFANEEMKTKEFQRAWQPLS